MKQPILVFKKRGFADNDVHVLPLLVRLPSGTKGPLNSKYEQVTEDEGEPLEEKHCYYCYEELYIYNFNSSLTVLALPKTSSPSAATILLEKQPFELQQSLKSH